MSHLFLSHPFRTMRLHALLACLGLILALAATAGCGASTSTGGNTGNSGNTGGTPTATTATSPTATSAPTTCAQVAGFASATTATALTGFNYALPSNSVATTPQTSAGGAGQYTLTDMNVCAPNTTTELRIGATPRPLATALEFYGWGMMSTFPTGGDVQQGCPSGDTCYGYQVQTKNNDPYFQIPERFLAFGNVQDHGNGLITFHLKLAAPPATPSCGSDPNYDSLDQAIFGAHPIYQLYLGAPPHSATDGFSGVQVPPMTRFYSDSATGHTGYQLCSAGNATSVNAFMYHQLTTNGWTGCSGQPTPTATGGCFAYTFTAACGTQTTQITIGATNAANWSFVYGKPCFG